jgi:hypothetical protein
MNSTFPIIYSVAFPFHEICRARLAALRDTVWMVGVNIYPKENDFPLLFAPTNICLLGCLDGGVNVDVDERGRAGPTTNLLQFATF